MEVPVEVVGAHAHLTQHDLDILFGDGFELTPKKEMGHGLEYMSDSNVTLIGPKGELKSIPIWGPPQTYTQIEISLTDGFMIGVNAPLRLAGKIESSGTGKLKGPKGEVELEKGIIVPKRHMHLSPVQAKHWNVKNGQDVSVKIVGERGMTFHKVEVRIQEGVQAVVHLDRNEGNSVWIRSEAEGEIII